MRNAAREMAERIASLPGKIMGVTVALGSYYMPAIEFNVSKTVSIHSPILPSVVTLQARMTHTPPAERRMFHAVVKCSGEKKMLITALAEAPKLFDKK